MAPSEPTTFSNPTTESTEGLYANLDRAHESFWRTQTPIQAAPVRPFESGWAIVQFTSPEIQASANQTAAFTAAMIAEYQHLVNDTRNWQINMMYRRGSQWVDAPKPKIHDAWLMEDEGL